MRQVFKTAIAMSVLAALFILSGQRALADEPTEAEYKKQQDKWFTVKSWTATYNESYQKDVTWELRPGVTVTTSVHSTSSGTFTLDSSHLDMGIMEWYGNGSGSSLMTQTTTTTYSSPDGNIVITEVTDIRGSGSIGDLPDEDGYRENWGGSLSIDAYAGDYSAGFGVPEDGTSTLTRTVTGLPIDFSALKKFPAPLREMFLGLAMKAEEWASYSGPLEDAQGMTVANILGFGLFPETDDSVWYDLPESGLTLKGSFKGKNASRSWSLSPGGKIDPMVLEKTPDDWIPDAKLQKPARINVTGDGWNGEKVKVRFTLYEVTKEVGVCINSEDQNTDLDLEFDPNSSSARFDSPVETEDGWTIQTSSKVENVLIGVIPLDWGAWGKLKAEAEIDEDFWSPIFTKEGEPYITIPRDERGGKENKIADAFEIEHHLSEGLETMEDDEGSNGFGDGLTAYEEYRGLMIGGDGGRHITTNPEDTIDLFVHCESASVKSYIPDGTVVGGQLMIHLLDIKTDYVSSEIRLINPNSSKKWSVCNQHGIRLIDENIPEAGVVGWAVGRMHSPGTNDYVGIDLNELSGHSKSLHQITIIHELMHGCGIGHHGSDNEKLRIEGFDRNIAWWNGVNAGDIGCTMQYGWADLYFLQNRMLAKDSSGNPIVFQDTEDKIVWNYLCNTKQGSGNLKSEQLGPAAAGACLKELRVTDE